MGTTVKVRKHGSVAEIAMDAPKRNALDPALVDEVRNVMGEAVADQTVTALVFSSDGPSFCSGASLGLLHEVAADPLEDAAFEALGTIYDLFDLMQQCPLPTVAAVNGAVVGAGINLAMACDLRIVGHDLELVGFARAGVHPGGGHLNLLLSRANPSVAPAVALFGQAISAADAVAMGLAHEAVPDADLHARALEIAAGAGTDRALVERVTRSYRATASGTLTPAAAILLERAAQVWSLRRRFDDRGTAVAPTAP